MFGYEAGLKSESYNYLIQMPFLFSDDKPRKFVCGCDLRIGMIIWTALIGLQILFSLFSMGFIGLIIAAVPLGTGIWAIIGENIVSRVVCFWVWAIYNGIGIVLLGIVVFMSLAAGIGLFLFMTILLALCGLLAYLMCGNAWFYIEEGKDKGLK